MLKTVFLMISIVLLPFCTDAAARPTRSQADISEQHQAQDANILKRLSRKIPMLLGSSANTLTYIPRSDRDCSNQIDPGGTFRCKNYTSGFDGSIWTVASGKNSMDRDEVHLYKTVRGGPPVKYAIIHVEDRGDGDTVTTLTQEATEVYAASSDGQLASGRARDAQGQNSIERAAKELERALGTVVPGKALPPLKLPSFGR